MIFNFWGKVSINVKIKTDGNVKVVIVSTLRNSVGSFYIKASKSGGEMIMMFYHLFLYVMMNVERSENLSNSLKMVH